MGIRFPGFFQWVRFDCQLGRPVVPICLLFWVGGGSHCSDCLLGTTPKQKMLPFRPLLNRPGSIVEFPEPETLKLCGHKRSPNK